MSILSAILSLSFLGSRPVTPPADHSSTRTDLSGVHGIALALEVDSKTLLFVLVSADGAINRVGNGTFGNKDLDFYIGKTDPAIFGRVRSQVSDSILQDLGKRFQREEVRGAHCKLTVVFQFNDKKSRASEYVYGSESAGPPPYVADLVRAAVRETEGWWQQQRTKASRADHP